MKLRSFLAVLGYLLGVCSQSFAGPARVTDLGVTGTNGGVILTWTAPQPAGATTLAALNVRYNTSPVNALNWASNPQVSWLTDPGTPGTLQTAVITGLSANTTYYFALKVQDSSGLWSAVSQSPYILIGNNTYSIGLAWDKSTSAGGYTVTNYLVCIGTSSGTYDTTNSAGNATSYMVNGLQWGVPYYIACVAEGCDTNGNSMQSGYSNEILYHKP